MSKKLFFSIMLGCILTFGLISVSCDDGNGNSNGNDSNGLAGTVWKLGDGSWTSTITFTSTSIVTVIFGDGSSMSGSYTHSGNTVTTSFPDGTVITWTISGNSMTYGDGDFIKQ